MPSRSNMAAFGKSRPPMYASPHNGISDHAPSSSRPGDCSLIVEKAPPPGGPSHPERRARQVSYRWWLRNIEIRASARFRSVMLGVARAERRRPERKDPKPQAIDRRKPFVPSGSSVAPRRHRTKPRGRSPERSVGAQSAAAIPSRRYCCG